MKNTYNATQQAGTQNEEGHYKEDREKGNCELPQTVEEFHVLLQCEGDRRVTQALKTAYGKWQQEVKRIRQTEREKAEKLVKLLAEEREKEVAGKYREELEEKERALQRKELEIHVIKLLAEKNIPLEFIDFIICGEKEATMKRMKVFCSLWHKKG